MCEKSAFSGQQQSLQGREHQRASGTTQPRVSTHNIEKADNVGPARKVLQDFDLTLDLLLLHGLQDLYDHLVPGCNLNPLKDLGVLSAANLAHNLCGAWKRTCT